MQELVNLREEATRNELIEIKEKQVSLRMINMLIEPDSVDKHKNF